jgi:hypothetical protein
MHRLRAPSPAFVISPIALFLALGGTSYSAAKVAPTKHKDAGTVRHAPANGGSGSAESTESDAFCPAGTVVIGTASHSNDQGVEVSEVLVATNSQVAGLFETWQLALMRAALLPKPCHRRSVRKRP